MIHSNEIVPNNKNVKPLYPTIIVLWADMSVSKTDEICPLAIQNQISLISMHVPSLVKVPLHLLKLLSRSENMGMSGEITLSKFDKNLPICNPDLHNINAHTKFGENP